MSRRVVFDTNAVISALLFARAELAWLRGHWRKKMCVPLLSRATAAELNRALEYPKFKLGEEERMEVLGDYLPYCEIVAGTTACPVQCRDPRDQIFLDLAYSGKAEVLVTGDDDLLALSSQTGFIIENARDYRARASRG